MRRGFVLFARIETFCSAVLVKQPSSDNTPYEKIGTEVRSIADEIPFDIPETWEWVRCSTLGEIVRGSGIKRTETVPWGILHASAVAVTKYLILRRRWMK